MIIMMKMIIMMMMMIRMTVIPSRVYTTVMRTIMMMMRTRDLGPGPRDKKGAVRGARDEGDGDAGNRGGARDGRVWEAAGRKTEEARKGIGFYRIGLERNNTVVTKNMPLQLPGAFLDFSEDEVC